MSGHFDTLIYTDCRPGQGLQGTAGLQFQARSAGADRQTMSVVGRSLLYEPPSAWMNERRPVSDYPPSFGHVQEDGVLATAAGVYLGREANGSREGNQLTHSIVTTDPETYGLVRPAQLFDAPFWTTVAAPGTSCPQVADGWQPGPFDAESAQRFVSTGPGGADRLIALLSAVDRLRSPDAARVLFIAEDPREVLRWIATATLLLPQRRALALCFKVFTTNPSYARQPVVAVHPGWQASTASVDNDQGYCVFDLTTHRHSRVEPTATARLWVDLLTSQDVYDVLEAVEIADATGLPDEAAAAVAAAAVLRRPPPPGQLMAVVSWLRDGSAHVLQSYGGAVVDTVAADVADLPGEALLVLDAVARSGLGTPVWSPDRVASVRHALLAAEVHGAPAHGTVATEKAPALPADIWGAAERDAAADLVARTLAHAAPVRFEAVLRVAGRFGVEVRPTQVKDAAHDFVVDWASHPERRYDASLWPCGEQLTYLLHDELERRVARSDRDARAVGDAWWRQLLPEVRDVDAGLMGTVLATAMLMQPPAERHALADRFLSRAARDDDARGQLWRVAQTLWRWSPPDTDELALLSARIPGATPLPEHLFADLDRDLAQARSFSPRLAAVARDLAAKGAYLPGPRAADTLRHDDEVARLRTAVQQASTADDELLRRIQAVPAPVMHAHAGEMTATLLHATAPAVVLAVAKLLPDLAAPVARRLAVVVKKAGDPREAVTAFLLAVTTASPVYEAINPDVRKDLDAAVRRWVRRSREADLDRATRLVGDGSAVGAMWARLLDDIHGRGWTAKFKRRFGG